MMTITSSRSKASSLARISPKFWILSGFLLLVFVTGGSARMDAMSLPILYPASVVLVVISGLFLRRDHLRGRRWAFVGMLAIFSVIAVQLFPIPPSIWRDLAGRDLMAQIDNATGLSDVWRPLATNPSASWNALQSLAVPFGVLLLGLQLARNDLYRLLYLLVGLGLVSGLLGVFQTMGDPNGILYFYKITNPGAAVGAFANRNHAALYLACIFPMLAVFASYDLKSQEIQKRRVVAVSLIGLVLVPLVLVTGSRVGFVLSIIGLLGGALLYQPHLATTKARLNYSRVQLGRMQLVGVLAVVSLVLLTVVFSRAQAIDRLFADGPSANSRSDFWPVSVELFWAYFPWGAGAGSFSNAYKAIEPLGPLDSTYLNHAHNDWIEVAALMGIPGLALLASGLFLFLFRTFKIWNNSNRDRTSAKFARLASLTIAMTAAASMFDYPLRTTLVMCLFVIFVLWLMGNEQSSRSDLASDKRHG